MVLDYLFSGMILLLVASGHFGLWIWLYNRLNSTGLSRNTIKRTEKAMVLICLLIPFLLSLIELQHRSLAAPGVVSLEWSSLTFVTGVYAVGVGLFALMMAPFWLSARPQFVVAKNRMEVLEEEDLKLLQQPESNAKIYLDGNRFRRMAKLPGNQIVSLQRNRKRLLIEGLPDDLKGMRIAHLSDIHLTGQLSTAFYRLAMDWLIEQSPAMVVLSGDIVDYEMCLTQIRPVFEGLVAPLGMYFVLGNHDKRLPAPTRVCEEMVGMGWTDIGKAESMVCKGKTAIQLIGNELPWFRRQTPVIGSTEEPTSNSHTWKLGVSHSPDQFAWGVANGCQLLLCGHTHGGQIRFPVIGPVIAPSRYGTRYSSGVFSERSTLMHVSRGISGVHPFRWGCIPEVTILELASTRPE